MTKEKLKIIESFQKKYYQRHSSNLRIKKLIRCKCHDGHELFLLYLSKKWSGLKTMRVFVEDDDVRERERKKLIND